MFMSKCKDIGNKRAVGREYPGEVWDFTNIALKKKYIELRYLLVLVKIDLKRKLFCYPVFLIFYLLTTKFQGFSFSTQV